MAVRGIFTSDANITGTRKGDFASAILQVFPTGGASLFALSAGMESKDASDAIVTWFEELHIAGRVASTQTVVAGATSMTVDDASSYTAGIYCLVEETSEYVYIAGINSNTLIMERGFGGTTAATIMSGNHLQRIGTTFEESSNRPTAMANLGYPVFNFCQIFRNSWEVSRTARRTDYYTGDPVAKNKADCMLFHAEDIERAMWFGKRWLGARNGKPYRTMNGVANIIATNVNAAGGTTTFNTLTYTYIQPIFEKNIRGKPNERIAFCGNNAIAVINQIAKLYSTMYIEPVETEFGIKVMKWVTPFGALSLMSHPLFVENPNWTKNIYILHPGAIRLRYLSRTHTDAYDKDGTRAGVDGDFGVMTTEVGIEYHAEKTGGIITGLTAAA